MKKGLKSIAVVLVLFSSFNMFSQDDSSLDTRENFKVGIRAGVNLSNVYDEEGDDFVAENKAGFAGGGFLSIPFGKLLGFQPEIMYSQKGFKATGTTIFGDYDYKRTTSYLDIPLQLQIKPTKEITILAGPQYSYLLDTKNEFNGTTNTQQEDDINGDNYKKNIFGFVVGADFNLSNFIISARGGWDISQSNADGDSTKPRYKNQLLQLTLGYAF